MKDPRPIFARKTFLLWCFFIACLQRDIKAQCVPGNLQSITYDTIAAGTGNSSHVFSLSQFNPALGTIVAAKINSVVTVNYGFTLQNVETVQRNFTVSVGRYDQFSSVSIGTPYSNTVNTGLGSFLLNPNQTVSRALSTILYRYVNSDSLTSNLISLTGNGSVSFSYKPITYTNLSGSSVYNYSASAGDTVHFSITYYYCNNITLSALLSQFQATRQGKTTVDLSWVSSPEQPGRTYTVQKSRDGVQFSSVKSFPSSGFNLPSAYSYQITPEEHRILYFRLMMTDDGGETRYSEIKEVDMSDGDMQEAYLYPNPSGQFVQIAYNRASPGIWIVEVLGMDGRLIQTDQFTSINTARIDFRRRLPAGVYILRATEQDTRTRCVLKFMVQ